MKCNKIRGIEKSICTCEQKIAYNYSFAWRDTYLRRASECTTEAEKKAVFEDIADFINKEITTRDNMKKYNADAIMTAFRNGFLNYCEKFFIATSYEAIGQAFTLTI